MVTKSELLAAAIERLAAPEHWTQRAAARTAQGTRAKVVGTEAASWCVTGAIMRELHEQKGRCESPHPLFNDLHRDLSTEFAVQFPMSSHPWLAPVSFYNDHPDMTHEGMLAVLEKTLLTLIERGE